MMKKLAPGLAAVIALCAASAHAGANYETAYCTKSSDGSGYCYGTMLGFRNHWYAGTQVTFEEASDYSPVFRVTYQHTTTTPLIEVSCIPNAATKVLWPRATLHTGYFAISWNAAGECTRLTLSTSSRFATP
jgi:hypothetical protein